MAQHELSISPSARTASTVRTCIGCRQRELTTQLVRIVARGDIQGPAVEGPVVVEIDARRRLGGRGAWLHPSAECLHQAERRRAFGRALRITGSVNTEALERASEFSTAK